MNSYYSENTNLLDNVRGTHEFIFHNGSRVRNIQELYCLLQNIPAEVFCHHVTNEKNDFAQWIRDIQKDYKLANSLDQSKDKETCIRSIRERIYEIEKVIEDNSNNNLINGNPNPSTPETLSPSSTTFDPLLQNLSMLVSSEHSEIIDCETDEKNKNSIPSKELNTGLIETLNISDSPLNHSRISHSTTANSSESKTIDMKTLLLEKKLNSVELDVETPEKPQPPTSSSSQC